MLDGQMTAAEESRLADLLRDDPEIQQVYLDFCWTHALLRRELGGYRDCRRFRWGERRGGMNAE